MRKTTIAILAVFTIIATIGVASAGTIVDVNMDIDFGGIDITANGFDHSSWHPGGIGETNKFTGLGSFEGTYKVNDGSYGKLNSYINVNSKDIGADFIFEDWQDFNILSANHINNVKGYFYAHASGNDDQVAMNLKSIGSMYVWSEATNPYNKPCLRGSIIEKEVDTWQDDILKTQLYLGVSTNGIATMHNSNIWGWSNGEKGTSTTNYGGGTRTVESTGSGTFIQTAYGANYLHFNGAEAPNGGTATLTIDFTDGFNFQGYTMTAK